MELFFKKSVKYLIILAVIFMFKSHLVEAGDNISKIFGRKCAKCHGVNGKATKRGVNLGAKNFADLSWQQSVTDKEILNTIMNGKGKMPDWKSSLSQGEIEGLVHYVRVLLPNSQRKKMAKEIQGLHYSK